MSDPNDAENYLAHPDTNAAMEDAAEIERLWARVGVDAGVIAGLRNPPPCKWQLDPIDCVYDTSCGESWVFPDGNAEENGVKFCPGCGHPVELTVTEVEDE